jgi:cob(I)alamin adenosyltransferase
VEEQGPGAFRPARARGWQKARSAILDGEHFLVVLDEITYPLIYGWLPLEDVLQTLAQRPRACMCA